jgi:hypothetical protein
MPRTKADRRTLLLGVLLVTVPNAPIAALEDGGRFADVFEGVPLTRPAYGACQFLETEFGIPTGYPPGSFASHRVLNRYEFAVPLERMLGSVKICIADIRAGKPPRVDKPSEPPRPGLVVDYTKLRAAFTDRRRLDQLLTWFRPILEEFAVELKLLGHDMAKIQSDLSSWRRDTGEIVRKARAIK